MCGITGYINLDYKAITNTVPIISMLKTQIHRGPDDSGIRAFNLTKGESLELSVTEPMVIPNHLDAIIGFNRLSILDLSSNGHQPMLSPDGKVILAMNGEIYNAFDLKPEMISAGYRFKSTTDTEVVLALYIKYGFEGMIKRLNGMFAIVIADLRSGILYISRDRFGIKPMYFIANRKILAFSSEIKSFRYLDDFNFELNEKQLDEHILFRNNIEGTLFKEVQSLTPGHYLTFTQASGLKLSRYFDINSYQRVITANNSLHDNSINFESLLSLSVESQLMSDVKLGCQLSGGIDSSLVTWYANRTAKKRNFYIVSVIFDDKIFTEQPYIDLVTNQLGITSHKFLLDAGYYLDHFEKAIWHLEAPLNHPNTIGIYLLSQQAKNYVTVLLSGEGADEVFGGYPRYYDLCYPYFNKNFAAKLWNGIENPREIVDYFYPSRRAVLSTAFMPLSIAQALMPSFSISNAMTHRINLYETLIGSRFTKQVKYEILTYLPDLLIRQDKMSMAHSIENRVPFLDNNLVESSFSIPEQYLVKRYSPEGGNTEKYLLKRISANIFGKDFAFRDKMGFSIPLKKFFADKRFLEFLLDQVLPGIHKRGIMDHKLVDRWLNNLSSTSYVEMESLWIAIVFEIWASTFLTCNEKI